MDKCMRCFCWFLLLLMRLSSSAEKQPDEKKSVRIWLVSVSVGFIALIQRHTNTHIHTRTYGQTWVRWSIYPYITLRVYLFIEIRDKHSTRTWIAAKCENYPTLFELHCENIVRFRVDFIGLFNILM